MYKRSYDWDLYFNSILIVMYLYYSFLFRRLPGLGVGASVFILGALVLLSIVAGFYREIRLHRGGSTLTLLLLPLEIYAIVAYSNYIAVRKYMLWTALIALILAAVYSILLFARRVQTEDPEKRKQILHRRAGWALRGLGNLFVYSFAFLFVIGIVRQLCDLPLVPENSLQLQSVSEDTLYNHMDTLCVLEDGSWDELSLEERLEILQLVADIQINERGLSHSLTVISANLDENTLGNYEESSYQISINESHLETGDADELLQTVLHEIYHAEQHQLVYAYNQLDEEAQNLKYFATLQEYKEEFSSYTEVDSGSDEDEYYEYYFSTVETNARYYAEAMAERYLGEISDYLALTSDGEAAE